MHIAIENNDLETIIALLDQNIERINDKSTFIDIVDQVETSNDKTALDIAIDKNEEDIINLLLEYGQNDTIDEASASTQHIQLKIICYF